jgi:glycosyltransferase 2 family protein
MVTGRPVAPGRQRRILPPARYRHPGDVIRLIAAALVLAGSVAAVLATHGIYAGASATTVTAVRFSTTAGRSATPGGLGAIEAALVAGLTGIGMSSGLAVSAVLLYRLATYWLPVAPGWVSLRLLQRRDYV